MNPELQLFGALSAGLFGSIHCVAMCGGISTALGVSTQGNHKSLLSLVFQLGRLISYALAGAAVAYLGVQLTMETSNDWISNGLRLLSVLFMVSLGLYLAGWFPKFAHIERIGLPVWRRISPISKKLIPVKSIWQALPLGFIWGWIPCGLVYSVLIWSIAAPSPLWGGLIMLSFGLGTLPAMFAMALGGSQLLMYLSQPIIRRVLGIIVILLALYALLSQFHLI